jgi:hypothetical protein
MCFGEFWDMFIKKKMHLMYIGTDGKMVVILMLATTDKKGSSSAKSPTTTRLLQGGTGYH